METTTISMPMTSPMASPLSCAQVLDLPFAAAERAHVTVGYDAAAFDGGASAPMAELALAYLVQVQPAQLVQLVRPEVQVQGTNVPNGKPVASRLGVIGTDPVGGVRGIPPRGWPV